MVMNLTTKPMENRLEFTVELVIDLTMKLEIFLDMNMDPIWMSIWFYLDPRHLLLHKTIVKTTRPQKDHRYSRTLPDQVTRHSRHQTHHSRRQTHHLCGYKLSHQP